MVGGILFKDCKSYSSKWKINLNSNSTDFRNIEEICIASKYLVSFKYLHSFFFNRVLISAGLMGKPELNCRVNLTLFFYFIENKHTLDATFTA